MEAENLTFFMIYESHLLWSYLLGYTWGRTDKRREIPIKNNW